MSRLASLTPSRGSPTPSSPNSLNTPGSSSPRKTSSPGRQANGSTANETTYHRMLKLIIGEIKGVFETWEDLILVDGLKAGKGCLDEGTEMDNILIASESAERPRLAPHLENLERFREDVQNVLSKLDKLVNKLSALIDQAENLFFEAYRTQGADFVLSQPLWLSWTFEHFIDSLPPLLSLHYAQYTQLHSLADDIRNTETKFEDAKIALEQWRDLGRGGERCEAVREWENLTDLEMQKAETSMYQDVSASSAMGKGKGGRRKSKNG